MGRIAGVAMGAPINGVLERVRRRF